MFFRRRSHQQWQTSEKNSGKKRDAVVVFVAVDVQIYRFVFIRRFIGKT